jgi:ERF superfamily
MDSQRTYADLETDMPQPANGQIVTAQPVQQEMSMLRLAIEKGAPIETIERLVALQEKMLARQAETEFNHALNRVQSKIQRIAPDLENTQKHSKYASYAAIDRVIRPIYAPEGFSISFTHAECPKPDHIRVIGWLRLGAHKEPYQVDWPVDTKGPQGSAVMTATQATGASDSYAKRYLVKDMFNIAIGEDDRDGNLMPENQEKDFLLAIHGAASLPELERAYKDSIKAAISNQDYQACKLFKEARDKRGKELRG